MTILAITIKLKNIKYFILNNKITGYAYLLTKLFLNGKIIRNFFLETHAFNICNSKINLNIFNYEHIKILNHNHYDHPNIQSFRNLNLNQSIFFVQSKDNLITRFFNETLKANLKKKILDLVKNKINKKKILILDNINNNFTNNKKIFNLVDLIFLKKDTNILNKYFYKYNFIQGRIFQNKCEYPYYFKLLSKEKINIKRTIKNKISGFSTIKDFNLYPFDLAYESILPYVDEFILGIDTASFNDKNKMLLKLFIKKTKFKNKIKTIFFDFNSNTTLGMKVRGRWITDANNKIINECSGDYCFYIQADEIFPYVSKKLFKRTFIGSPEEVYFNFLHFVYDLETIIDPAKSSYSKAIRIFKKNLYAASHDGFSFQKLDHYRPKIYNSENSIYHISYVYKYKEKIRRHFENKKGLHINQMSKNNFLNKYIVEKKISNIKNELIHLKHMMSFKYIN
jgi:hypothetical protein